MNRVEKDVVPSCFEFAEGQRSSKRTFDTGVKFGVIHLSAFVLIHEILAVGHGIARAKQAAFDIVGMAVQDCRCAFYRA